MSGSLMPGLGDASLMPFVNPAADEFPWASYLSDENTIAWWKFDETADGSPFADATGNGFTMLNGGVSEAQKGIFNYAIYLDGGTDYTKTTLAAPLNIGRNLTVDIIAKRMDAGTGCIIGYWNFGGGPAGVIKKVGWVIGVSGTDVYFNVRTKNHPNYPLDYFGVAATFDRDDMPVGNWYFLRATYDGLYAKLYGMDLTAGETTLVEKASKKTYGGDISYRLGVYDTLAIGALNFDNNPANGQDHFRGHVDQCAISNVIRTYAYGYKDILPTETEVVNIGRLYDRYDNIYCKKIHADNNLLNPPENTCFVSPSYSDDPGSRTFSTIQAAIDHANSQSPADDDRWLIVIEAGEYEEVITLSSHIYLVGRSVEDCIIKNSSKITHITTEYTGFENLTFEATGTEDILTISLGAPGRYPRFHNCKFVGTDDANTVRSSVGGQAIFELCIFENTASNNIIGVDNNGNNDFRFHHCRITGVVDVDGGSVNFEHTDITGSVELSGSSDFNFEKSSVTNTAGHALVMNTTGDVYICSTTLVAAGLSGGTNYRTMNITAQPASCFICSTAHKWSVAQPNYLFYSSVAFQFYGKDNGYQRGMNGNCRNLCTGIRRVSSIGDEYNIIQQAINAAVSGNVVEVSAGTYTEQITMKAGVVVQGINKSACILQRSSEPIAPWTTGDGATKVKDMTVKVTTPGSTIVELRAGYRDLFEDCSFEDGIVKLVGANLFGFPQFEFEKCTFVNSGGNVIEAAGTTNSPVFLILKNCLIFEDSLGISWTIVKSAGGRNELKLQNTDMRWGRINVTSSVDLYISGGVHYNEGGNPNIMSATTGRVEISKATYENDGATPISFTGNPSAFVFANNVIVGSTSYDITSTVSVTNATVSGNVMVNGMDGNIKINSATKLVQGGVDFYKDLVEALASVNTDNCTVQLNADQTIAAALTPPSYAILIDGQNQFAITRAAGSPLMTLGDNDNVKFVNIDLVGSIDISGDAAKLFLADHTYLVGLIDIISGNGSTRIDLDQCKVEGDASDQYCIRIADADPVIVVKRAYLKGDAGDPAVYWAAANDNVKLAYATVMHGSLGANNPFGRSAAQTPNYASHHCAYNSDPETGAIWTNLIAAGQRFDTLDVDADY